jgi:hypothetical protein
MTRLEELYGRAMKRRKDAAGGCVSPEELLALVRSQGSERRRLEVLDHVMGCEACHREFELLRAFELAGARTAESVSVRSIGRRWQPLALAASIVLALGLGLMARNRYQSSNETRAGGHGLVLLAPATEIAPSNSITFAWRPLPGADRYRLELMDSKGAVLFSQLTVDTVLAISGDRLAPGKAYSWWVRDATPGAQLASGLRPLRISSK